jgi:hypothetical protein
MGIGGQDREDRDAAKDVDDVEHLTLRPQARGENLQSFNVRAPFGTALATIKKV